VAVKGLRTRYGSLDLTLKRRNQGFEARIAGIGRPRGGVVVSLPGVTPRWTATADGRRLVIAADGSVRVLHAPAVVTLSPPAR
jgi:hypothetical protein